MGNPLFSFIPANLKDTWAVYRVAMSDDPTTTIYLGLCPLRDLPTMPDARQNTEAAQLFNVSRPINIELLFTALNQFDAAETLTGMIKHKLYGEPFCNLQGKKLTQLDLRKCAIRHIETGDIYPSIAAAARHFGVRSQMIGHHLNNPMAYSHVRGNTFERV